MTMSISPHECECEREHEHERERERERDRDVYATPNEQQIARYGTCLGRTQIWTQIC